MILFQSTDLIIAHAQRITNMLSIHSVVLCARIKTTILAKVI